MTETLGNAARVKRIEGFGGDVVGSAGTHDETSCDWIGEQLGYIKDVL
jgi:hypothetical protein